MSLHDSQLQSLRQVAQRYTNIARQFDTVSKQLGSCENILVQLLNSGKLFHRTVFQKIIDEASNKISPIELLTQGMTTFVDRLVSLTMTNFGADRKITLLEDRIALMKKANSRESTNNTEIISELGATGGLKQRIDYEDGYYLGEVKDGMRNGSGEFFHKNGNYCIGTFNQDKLDGYGEFFWKNGNIYKGQFRLNKLEGRGVIYFANGDIYEGDMADDDKHGQGIFYYKDDTRFNGHFVKGKKHGLGVRFYPEDERYEGNYNEDRRDGKGTYYFKDGSKEVRIYEKGYLKASQKYPGHQDV